jgi:hypothetical protein
MYYQQGGIPDEKTHLYCVYRAIAEHRWSLGSDQTCQHQVVRRAQDRDHAKLKAKGVTGYTLEIKAASEVKDEKVVGSCEGGTKKIVYSRK